MVLCPHIESPDIRPPSSTQPVYREDCTQCFDSIDDSTGLNVCLSCFNGGCTGERNHALIHSVHKDHPVVLNIKRTRKKVQRDEPPQKMSKLAISAETEEDHYDTATKVVCYKCEAEEIDDPTGKLATVVEGIMTAMTFSTREEVKAWEQEFVPCEHTLCLVQQDRDSSLNTGLNQCSGCQLHENLWLCLECGNVACGRSQFGGVGGNSHALAHADTSSHGVAVKLGSITPEGGADIFCYKCNEERTDPDIASHLAHWGINIAESQKTEKSLMELQVEQNLRWEFSMTTEDGHVLQPIFGAGFTGLKNLGNSCYLASIVQCLFSLEEFQQRYFRPNEEPPLTENPAEDFETQMRKLADGLLSGRYSKPDTMVSATPDSTEVPHQKGLPPAMFKYLIGRGHPEFSTMRQQDAFEFLLHLFKLVTLSKHSSGHKNPVDSFRFMLEQRIQCLACEKVRYKYDEQDNISIQVPARPLAPSDELAKPDNAYQSVTIKECLDIFTGEEIVELECPACGSDKGFRKRSLFQTLPLELVVNARRFELINWVPTKLNIPVEIGDVDLDLSSYISQGPLPTESFLPDEPEGGNSAFVANTEALQQLLNMGFPQVRCEKALHATGNLDVESAANWLFAHMEDPDIDEPMPSSSTQHRAVEHDAEKINQLGEMGIEPERAAVALSETGGDVNRALDWVFSHPDDWDVDVQNSQNKNGKESSTQETPGSALLPAKYRLQSLVCHKGASLHAGHYVAFIRKQIPNTGQTSWVLFNDEKVVEADNVDEMKQFAYVYIFSRV
ncbi:putative ubiquitin C-terminal hydrolase [Talaromyces proteolyticus]|uniref:Ubiquitin carboxyl-terminal hydrolase n=1 Tax=Talaromyces proteolyticus TaxID=1131652 RepID=A0AAD4L2E2_9EURO|nr:putative ubiquitin C-terminal hydrolase [Talaromyces proteolyticus]KAH8704692.1 putative ubiquitin C-terminal hydrolase [Talaromyces proteolyticus]